jgi:hypothetical protein
VPSLSRVRLARIAGRKRKAGSQIDSQALFTCRNPVIVDNLSKHEGSASPRRSRMVRSKGSKQCLWVIGASSHMIKERCTIKSARKVPLLMWHMDDSSMTIGILNRKWAVRPPGSNREAIPDEATARTMSFSDRRREIIAFQRNVFPVPPHPYTKKGLA